MKNVDIALEEQRKLYPRVSEIYAPFTRAQFEKIPLEILVRKQEIGTQVHAYCTGIAKKLWLPPVPEECKAYVDSFFVWASANIDEYILARRRLYDDVKRFTGELDFLVKLKDKRTALLDLKTSASVSKSWAVQLAAYDSLATTNGYSVDVVLNIHLSKVGEQPGIVNAELKQTGELKQYADIFQSCLNGYDFFTRKEPKRKKPVGHHELKVAV